jgi:CRP/FNR family cyclic AMP-dependent transcriptional regulator
MSLKADLKKPYLFQELNDSELRIIEAISEVKTFNRGDHIFNQHDVPQALFVIQYGSVRSEAFGPETDHEYGYGLLGNGSMFGEASFLSRTTRALSATAMENVNVIQISFSALKAVLDENKDLALKVYQALGKHLGNVFHKSMLDLTRLREQSDHRRQIL